MKKIIDGKRYDTDESQLIGEKTSGHSPRDFNHYSEALYLTRKGAYFLAGEGGPLTKYGVQIGNDIACGSAIFPFSKQEAFGWAQENLMPEEVEAGFPADIDDA